MSLTPEQIQTTTDLLKQLPVGELPVEVFYQFARITVLPTVEMVPLVLIDGEVKVLLIQRPDDDPYWAGMVHIPGSVIRSTDTPDSMESAFNRILHGELNSEPTVNEPVFMEYRHHQVLRGREVALIHWVEMKNPTSAMGKYFSVNDLPPNLVPHQRDFIQKAAEIFKTLKNK